MASIVYQIQCLAADAYDVDQKDLIGPRRTKTLSLARDTAIYASRMVLGLSYPELAKAFGRNEHTTALCAVKRARKRKLTDEVFCRILDGVISRVTQTSVGRGVPVLVHVSDVVSERIDLLTASGLWGFNREETAQRLISWALLNLKERESDDEN